VRVRRVGPLAAVVIALAFVAEFGAPAYADRSHPSAQEVARAKVAATAKAEQAGQAKARLVLADQKLVALRAQTDAAIAAFQVAQGKLALAQRAAARAAIALQGADQQVFTQRRTISAVVTAAYRGGGDLAMVSTLMSSKTPETFLESAGAMNTISSRQSDALGRLRALRVVQQLAQQEAASALATVKASADAAAKARANAERLVSSQQSQVVAIAGQKVSLERQASSLKSVASDLARQRAENLAAARAAADAARKRRELNKGGGVAQENPTAVTGGPRPAATAAQGLIALDYAKRQLGKPYEWGAAGPNSFDCSGLTMQSWASAGIGIDHWSVAQYGEGDHVARADLRAGDLVFFATDTSDASTIHHVGIYAGNGMMINAPHTGANVRYDPAFRSDYIGATRP
jgi:cell wall-associated NlpC family hydrolase